MLRPGVTDSEELSTESRIVYHTANKYLENQYFTVTHDSCCDMHLAPIQGYYKKISDRTWRREGRVFMCCPCRFANHVFLRFEPIPPRDHPELTKSLWSISFYSQGGFDYWYLWSDGVKPDKSRWFWRSQAESNLKVEVGRQPLCCIHRGCFGSFLSSVTVPTFILLCGLLAVSMQLVSLPFFLVFGIFIWVCFHLCTCCLDSRKVLDHSDHLVEDYKDVLPRVINRYVPGLDSATRNQISDLLLDFSGLSLYPPWYTMQTKGTCNMFQWQTWPIQGHYQKVGWLNDAPVFRRRGKVYTWLPKLMTHADVWIFYGGNSGTWFTTFDTPSEDYLSSYIWKCKLQNYDTFNRMIDSSDAWVWDDDTLAAVKLTEGRTWILNSVGCPTCWSIMFFISLPSYLLLFGIAMATASTLLLSIAFIPLLIVICFHFCFEMCRYCGCCCSRDEMNDESDSQRLLS